MNIFIEKVSETYVRIFAEPSVDYELHDHFTFTVPGFRFMPAFRRGTWNGKVHLFNLRTKCIYTGLLPKVLKFCEDRGYEVHGFLGDTTEPPSELNIIEWTRKLGLPGISPRDFQINAVWASIQNSRALLLSPTASGKSLIAYLLFRWYGKKTLIIVPTTGLVHQLAVDFADYGYKKPVHKIYEGQSKDSDTDIVISTWQSIYKLPKDWFEQFEVVIGDEAHLFKATSLITIMEKLDTCKFRFGMTGTLDDSKTNKMVLEGLFGSVYQTTTTAELIEKKILSNFKVECITLQYPDKERKDCKVLKYQEEMDYLVTHPKRNEVIKNLVTKLKGNTLVLFRFVDKHGEQLYKDIKKATKRPVYFISGKVDAEEREKIRQLIETQKDVILVASEGTTSTGINIVSLKHIVFASPSKGKIRILQSIGRVLRRSKTKTNAILWDISDDLSWKSRKNYTLNHAMERVKIYNQEKFDYRLRTLKLEGK